MTKITDSELTQEHLLAALRYDPETGQFFRRLSNGRERPAGSIARGYHDDSHVIIGLARESYTAHTLAWFYVYGEKRADVYHLNLNKTDNRIANLAVP